MFQRQKWIGRHIEAEEARMKHMEAAMRDIGWLYDSAKEMDSQSGRYVLFLDSQSGRAAGISASSVFCCLRLTHIRLNFHLYVMLLL
jgi:hypothetical protein